ncbi:MAG: hypothetical protein ACJAT2_000148 [Bacteriovoracaceae bacterium]|jgi:hypothetical protein
MFEDLIEKLKTSIEELRKKLPGGGSSEDDDEYEDEDEYEEKYHGDGEEEDDDGKTVKVQIKDLLKEGSDEGADTKEKTQKIYSDSEEDDEDYEDDEDDEDADAAAKKRKKFIIYGAALALIAVLLLDPQKEDEVPAPVKVVKKKKRVRKKPKKKPAPPVAVEKPAAMPEVNVLDEKPKVVDIPPETPAEVIKPAEASETTDPIKPTEPAPVAVTPTPKAEVDPEPTPKVEPPSEIKPMGEASDAGELNAGIDMKMDDVVGADESTEKNDMASMIEKKTEYISPPNYERSGRGLVYNCVAKHWACVDKFSYLTCRENTKWSTENSKAPECVTKNVYATLEDCVTIQKHYIEKSEPTDFCNGSDGATEESSVEEDLKILE